MKYLTLILIPVLLFFGCNNSNKEEAKAVNSSPTSETISKTTSQEPWSESDLMAPETLANMILEDAINPKYIISIGFENVIKNSVDLGPANNPVKLQEFRSYLEKLPKDAELVLYCGCCPFKDCPNIRPAMRLAKEMNFTNVNLLDIENNIRIDWIDLGYPVNKK